MRDSNNSKPPIVESKVGSYALFSRHINLKTDARCFHPICEGEYPTLEEAIKEAREASEDMVVAIFIAKIVDVVEPKFKG